MASDSQGIRVLDISDPSSPQQVNVITSPDRAECIVMDGAYAYAGYEVGGGGPRVYYLQVFEVTDPETLQARGSVVLPRQVLDIEIVGHHAYVSTVGAGFFCCNVADPDNPYILGTLYTKDVSSEAAHAGGYILIADWDGGLQVAPLDCGLAGIVVDHGGDGSNEAPWDGLLSACPNPFGGSTRLLFDVTQSAHVSLSVYDVTGARISSLVDRVLPPGRHTATFAGGGLAPGIYFAVLDAGGRNLTKKIVLAK
jgi:hypothetical protein